jgi:hypothetical protein
MSENNNVQIENILAYFRELVGQQAQEIAVLRAALESYQRPAPKAPTEAE